MIVILHKLIKKEYGGELSAKSQRRALRQTQIYLNHCYSSLCKWLITITVISWPSPWISQLFTLASLLGPYPSLKLGCFTYIVFTVVALSCLYIGSQLKCFNIIAWPHKFQQIYWQYIQSLWIYLCCNLRYSSTSCGLLQFLLWGTSITIHPVYHILEYSYLHGSCAWANKGFLYGNPPFTSINSYCR